MAQRRRHKSRKKKPAPLKTATARIDSIGARGDGVAIVEGEKVFVPFSAPGDEASITYRGDRGKIETLLHESEYRAAPPCEYFGECGGCALQHLSADYYHEWKRQLVIDALSWEGFDAALVAPLVACAPASRRRAVFAVRRTSAGLVFGFNERASSRLVAIKSCLILAPELSAALPTLRKLAETAPTRWKAFDLHVTFCDNGLDVVFTGGDADDDLTGAEIESLTGCAQVTGVARVTVDDAPVVAYEAPVVRFGSVPVAIPPGGFLQASVQGEAALTEFVTSHGKGANRIADLFCGCGTFSLPLAQTATVDAFDSDAPAIASLDASVRGAGLGYPMTVERRNLFERPLSSEELKIYDTVVFDPPRAGAKAQAAEIAKSAVPTVIGVSCNPTSFARDAATLREGGYRLSQVLPVDQFVYAPHVELAGLFTRG